MSLINDALRRASKTQKERPPETPVASGMEPVPPAKGSRANMLLGVLALVVLLLAGWFFWQWWTVRNKARTTAAATTKIVQTTANQPVPTNATAPKPTGTILFVRATNAAAPAATSAPGNSASPGATTASTPPAATAEPASNTSESAPAVPTSSAQVITPNPPATPTAPPVYVDEHIALPIDLTVSAILFNKTDPHALMNGQLYGVGDIIQGGVTIKAIEKNRVIMEFNGHTKILMVGE